MRFDKRTTAQVAVPPGKSETVVFDDDVPGFGLRVRTSGSRTWVFQYRQGAKQRRLSLGAASAIGLQDARALAAKLHAQVKLGGDPAGEKIEKRARASETMGAILQSYLARKKAELRPRSFDQVARHLLVHSRRLHGLQLDGIDRRAAAALVAAIASTSGATEANRVRASLSAFFAWAMREGLADSNPIIATNTAVEAGARSRVLTAAELRALWTAAADDDYGLCLKLLALTGCRREEIGALRWAEVNLERAVISLPAERTKNGHPHDIPLSEPALEILNSKRATGDTRDRVFGKGPRGFRNWHGGKAAVDCRLLKAGHPIDDWRLHDLRRTMSTMMHEELQIPPHVVEAVINHVSGHRAGVAGVYNRAQYTREKAVALARWAEWLTAVVRGEDSKIVTMPRAG